MDAAAVILAALLGLRSGPEPARAEAIASDVAEVCASEPSPFAGPARVEACGLALVAIAGQETGFRETWEHCDCKGLECDGGSSWGAWQISHIHVTASKADFCGNRRMQATAALRLLSRAGFGQWYAPHIRERFYGSLQRAGVRLSVRPGRVWWADAR